MTKQTIEVEGLPEGIDISKSKLRITRISSSIYPEAIEVTGYFIKEKIQPRRIVLEETESVVVRGECRIVNTSVNQLDIMCFDKIWREVKETDIPLNSGEPYKKLSVDDGRELLNYLPNNTEFYKELVEFIKENS